MKRFLSLTKKHRYKASPIDATAICKSTQALMLIDYYTSAVATVGGDGYIEYVISTVEDSEKARLDCYRKDGLSNEELKTSYIVPYEVAEKCFGLINKHGLGRWNAMTDTISTDGQKTVCRFWDGKRHVRVSNEAMPKDGMAILEEIGNTVKSYCKQELLITD